MASIQTTDNPAARWENLSEVLDHAVARLWKRVGIEDAELHINSIGDAADRKAYRAKLIAHFEMHTDVLDEDKVIEKQPLPFGKDAIGVAPVDGMFEK